MLSRFQIIEMKPGSLIRLGIAPLYPLRPSTCLFLPHDFVFVGGHVRSGVNRCSHIINVSTHGIRVFFLLTVNNIPVFTASRLSSPLHTFATHTKNHGTSRSWSETAALYESFHTDYIVLIQVFLVWYVGPSEHSHVILTENAIRTLDTVHVAISGQFIYSYLISHHANFLSLLVVEWCVYCKTISSRS